jgi:3'(2'), 5'-bisphosphate nucleotidase
MSSADQSAVRVDRSACHEAARRAVLAASQVCRAVQSGTAQLRSVLKDDRSPVTVADFAAQAVVVKVLRDCSAAALPVVGEEDAAELRDRLTRGEPALAEAVVSAVRRVWPDAELDAVLDAIDAADADLGAADAPTVYWTLDPVDGTKGFLRGQQYAVSLALIENGAVTVGALACPNLPLDHGARLDVPDLRGSLYSAAVGDDGRIGILESACVGSEANPDEARPLHEREQRDPQRPITACGSVEPGHSDFSATDALLAHANGIDIDGLESRSADPAVLRDAVEPLLTRLDSQAKYAVVARGQADAYLRLPVKPGYQEKIWDHAAGALVARGAGVVVSDVTGTPLDFGQGQTLRNNRGVIAAPPHAHARIIEAIEALKLFPNAG